MLSLENKTLLVICFSYETFVKNLTEALSKHFRKVYVLVRYNPLFEVANFIPLPYFKRRRIFTKKYSIDLTNTPANVKIIPTAMWNLPMKNAERKLGEKQFLASLKATRSFNISFDIIHAHYGFPCGYAAVELKRVFNKPCVITGHGYDVYDFPFRDDDWRSKYKFAYENADEVVTVSRNNSECLKRLGLKKEAHIIPNGFSKALFHFKPRKNSFEKLGLPADKKIILTIGTFVPEKGYEYLLKALKIISRQRQDFLCIHIGSGVLQESLLKMAGDMEITSFIRFLGAKPHRELVDWYGACDFFVSSSIAEGNPTVLFESLGCGKAFVGTKVGGVPDIVTSEDYGLLADPGDENALANNILLALDRKWNPEKILRYAEQFTWEKIAEQYLSVFYRLPE